MNDYAKNVAELTLAGLEKRVPVFVSEFDIERAAKESIGQQLRYLWLVPLTKSGMLSSDMGNWANQQVFFSLGKALLQDTSYKALHAAFEKNGIRNLPIKGICLKELYSQKEMREMGDIDILVYPEDIEKCRELMPRIGYTLLKDEDNHEIVYGSPDGVHVEIHKSLYEETCDVKQYEYFCDRSRDELMEGCQYTYQFNVNDFYVYIMAHMARHFYEKGCGVRGLVDIYVYQKAYGDEMDKRYINKELDKLGIRTFVNQMEKMTSIWLGGEKSSELYDNIIDYMLSYGVYGEEKNGIWNKFSRDNHETENVRKLKHRYYFPSVAYLREYYPVLDKYP